ncbi:conserved phage C-terminal domain-containing protein [Staphylococcus pseudoxylosus]|uniref:conserved phage C-terminal domain-containing protein n=1 Tax=Staphylococcus pseudoxylosus TaxID=2282419 RepID=UPI002DBE81EE|nr:conserved phage C-terminal domain-containing protein [Staphylococcus pseudoxylosus]MEB6046008.1 conserved phage C-terminal domain-containing protein [Staphylococcus pseudoxylosus]
MATFRVYKESGNFVTVHKNFIHDPNISWKAKGILLYLLSRPDDWQVYEKELEKHSLDGRDSLKNGIKELETTGYIVRTRKRDDKGRLREYEYSVYEQPNQNGLPNVGLSNVGKTNTGLSNVGKPVPTNNDFTNNDLTNNNNTNNDGNTMSSSSTVYPYKSIIEHLNQSTGKHYKPTTRKTKDLIKARFKDGFDEQAFQTVINNKVTEWKGTEMEKFLRPETLFGTKFEGYLNQEIKNTGQDQLERMKYDPSYWD